MAGARSIIFLLLSSGLRGCGGLRYFLSDDEEAAAGAAVGVDVAVAGALLPEELESVLDFESPDFESPGFESPDFEPLVLDPDPLLSPLADFGLALP
jgi:hypothetical protein